MFFQSIRSFFSGRSGYIFAATAAITYGMNPLFALPLYGEGFDADSMLLFRYLPAALLIGILALLKGQSLALGWKEFFGTFLCGMLFSASSLFLFLSYQKMDAGIASTLLFVYPIMVAVIMATGFHERLSVKVWGCIGLVSLGIAMLCRTADGNFVSLAGLVLVMLSSLTYAVYMVFINRANFMRAMPGEKLTFYVILFGMLMFLFRLRFGLDFQGRFTPFAWLNIAGIAIFPAAVSLICTTFALQRVGATATAIIGALEPVTAVFFGVTVFGERLTVRICFGIVLILAAVMVTATQKKSCE